MTLSDIKEYLDSAMCDDPNQAVLLTSENTEVPGFVLSQDVSTGFSENSRIMFYVLKPDDDSLYEINQSTLKVDGFDEAFEVQDGEFCTAAPFDSRGFHFHLNMSQNSI